MQFLDAPLISPSFYFRNTVDVARDLLGKVIVRQYNGKRLIARIIETEAYCSDNDQASHAFRGKTKRNAAMFGPVGHAYVYFVYGNHFCLNVVARDLDNKAGAVLIRAVETIEGIEVMKALRKQSNLKHLTDGPGKLTQALAIAREHNGSSLMKKGELYLVDPNEKPEKILITPRIGIKVGREVLWRFCLEKKE
jgi:DNA-3-methyladenine glycosylase